MSRRQPPNYGPGQYPMHGPGYQAVQYGSGGYGTDMFDGSGASSYPTPVCSSIIYSVLLN